MTITGLDWMYHMITSELQEAVHPCYDYGLFSFSYSFHSFSSCRSNWKDIGKYAG